MPVETTNSFRLAHIALNVIIVPGVGERQFIYATRYQVETKKKYRLNIISLVA